MLSATHILTAEHVVAHSIGLYGYPSVLKANGIFKCELVHTFADLDVCLLKTIEQITPLDIALPGVFPTISNAPPRLGHRVGFMTNLFKNDTNGVPRIYQIFASADVQFRLIEKHPHPWFALSAAPCERSFSGCPVFYPSGELVGVVVEVRQMTHDLLEGFDPVVNYLPVMASIVGVRADILQFLNEG